MKKLRKFLVVGVMVLSIIAMSGLVIAPTAKASASAGDLIKMEGLSSVYYLGADGKRYVFPNPTTYFSWYNDFSGVVTIPASELQSYPLGGNVTMRPGTKLVKITTDPSVYAVEPNGVLRKIQSEAQAASLYGTNWNKRVVDVPDAFFTNYTVSTVLPTGQYPIGSLIKNSDSADIYYYDGTNYRKFASEAALTANRFKMTDVITASSTVTSSGTVVSGAEEALVKTSQNGVTTNPVNTGSGVMVSLASDTPAAMSVPSNATKVAFTKVNFTASNDGDTVINGVVVKRTGVGASTDISKVYIYDGNTRLGSGRTVSASTNEATFTNLGLTIPKGTTKTLTITADISNGAANTGATGNHAFGIVSASAVTTGGANVSGSFPVTGNTMSLSATSVGKMDVESSGSSYTRKVGETGVELANFSVYTNSTEDALFKGITLYNSARDVINNLKLYRGSDLVATGVKSGSYFIFTLDTPYSIEKGQSASFTVKGDVSGRLNDTAVLYVRYNTDIVLTGKTYGYNLAVDAAHLGGGDNSYIEEADSSPLSNTTTVQAGQLTAAFVGPNTGNVPKNTNNVELLTFNLTSQAAVDVSKFTVTIVGDGAKLATSDIDNLDLMIDGVIISTKAAVTVGDNLFTDTFTLPAGRTVTGKILVDINSTAAGDETIAATIKDMSSTTNFVAKTADGDTVTDIIPSGNMVGKTQSVLAASLSLNRASTPASAVSYVKGTSNIPTAGFAFTAGTATDVKVTSIKLTAYLDDDDNAFDGNAKNQSSGAKNVISTVGIYDGDTLLGTKKALTLGTSDITVTFDGLSLVIPKGTTKNIVAKIDTANNLNSNSADYVALTITSGNDVIAEYGTGTNLGATLSSNNNDPTVYQKIDTGGTLTVGLATDTPLKGMVLSGATAIPYTKVKFSATKEDFTVSELEIVNSQNDSNFTSIGLSYKNEAGATVTKEQALVASKASFNDLAIFVPKDSDTYVTVYGNMNTVSAGATNGNDSTLTADHDTNFKATGKSSGDVITSTALGGDATGYAMALYEAVPTVAFASNTPSGTLIPSINTHVARINISNAGTKSITLDDTGANTSKLTINLSATGGSGLTGADDTVSVKDKNGTTLCTTATFNLGTTAAFDCLFDSGTLTIGANSTEYVDVYVDTTELSAQGNTIQASLAPTAANFTWGINGTGAFATGDINFRGTLNGGSLVKP